MLEILAAAEEAAEGGEAIAYTVGAVVLAVFLILLIALLVFGKGREHS